MLTQISIMELPLGVQKLGLIHIVELHCLPQESRTWGYALFREDKIKAKLEIFSTGHFFSKQCKSNNCDVEAKHDLPHLYILPIQNFSLFSYLLWCHVQSCLCAVFLSLTHPCITRLLLFLRFVLCIAMLTLKVHILFSILTNVNFYPQFFSL